MSTKKAVATKKEEPKVEKAKEKNGSKGKEKEEVQAEAKSNGDAKKAKAEPEEKKTKKTEDAPVKAEKAEAKPDAKPTKAAKGSTSAKVYQSSNSYAVGEQIFHPVWKVEGTVVEVGKTPDGNTKIVVDFEDFGVRRLVAEHQAAKL